MGWGEGVVVVVVVSFHNMLCVLSPVPLVSVLPEKVAIVLAFVCGFVCEHARGPRYYECAL